jgi:hypothetical protein
MGKKLVMVPHADNLGMFDNADYFAATPLVTYVTNIAQLEIENNPEVSVTKLHPDSTGNYMPLSPGSDDQLARALQENVTHDVSMLLSCASRMLFQPGRLASAALAPHLAIANNASDSFGVHVRLGYAEMAKEDPVAMSRLIHFKPSSLAKRPSCIGSATVVNYTANHVESILRDRSRAAATRKAQGPVVVYVTGDSTSTIRAISQALHPKQAHVITSKGAPKITSEKKVSSLFGALNVSIKGSSADPYLKAVVDFFMLSRIQRWYSNCDFLGCGHGGPGHSAPGRIWYAEPNRSNVIYDEAMLGQVTGGKLKPSRCGDTFAGSIWIQRFAADARSPVLGQIDRF